MPIRILHVVDHLGKGGLENGLVNLIEHLDPARFEHVVYAIRKLGPNADRLAGSRIQVICQGKRDTDARFQAGTLARAIRQVRPDIVHSRNWGAVEAVLAGCWVRSCKVVHSEHGLEADAAAHEPKRRIWFRRLAYHLADRVFSVSYQLRELHAARTGFDPKRIAVIHNGVDLGRFCPDAAARVRVRRELGLAPDEFCVGCVGNLFPVKGHLTALQGIEGLAARSRNWRLLLIGEGPERQKLEAFVAQRPDWKNHVQLPGTSHRVPDLLQAMDVYVLPSISEGISNSLLEAMASGIPVVATATGGNPEVVVDGESGLLFRVGDAPRLSDHLLRLEADKKLRADLAERALRRVREEFSLDSMVGKYAQLYESLERRAAIPVHAAAGV
jgi:sugar transferase (PEP-CTERM/EpsH1 system associated)